MKLTHLQVSSAKPKEKPYRLSDGNGLYLQVTPTGGKWWRFRYFYGRAYNRTAHVVERKKMMQLWADYLDGLKQGAKVIPLRRQA